MAAKRKHDSIRFAAVFYQHQQKNKYVNVNEQLHHFGGIVQPIAVSPFINFLFKPHHNRRVCVLGVPPKLIMYENVPFHEIAQPNNIPPNGIRIQ